MEGILIGPQAEADLLQLRLDDGRLARRLARALAGLLDTRLDTRMWPVPDPPGAVPRFAAELEDGWIALFRVELGQDSLGRKENAVWIERVVEARALERMLRGR